MNRIRELYEQHYQTIFRYFLRMTGNWEEAGDLTQETFFQACLSIYRYRQESSLKTWLFSIARNVYLKRLRKEKKYMMLPLRDGPEFFEDSTKMNNLPADLIVQREERERVQASLKKLPENMRTILIFKEFEQLSYEEIAGIFSQTANWARVNYFRAKKQLAQVYRELEGDYQ